MRLFSNGCSFLTERPKDNVPTFVTKELAREYKDDFIKNIRNKLSSLTNLNWNIDLSDDDSAHTYTKLKDMELNIKKENIRNNPLVESIIDNFPDSQISEIKDK